MFSASFPFDHLVFSMCVLFGDDMKKGIEIFIVGLSPFSISTHIDYFLTFVLLMSWFIFVLGGFLRVFWKCEDIL